MLGHVRTGVDPRSIVSAEGLFAWAAPCMRSSVRKEGQAGKCQVEQQLLGLDPSSWPCVVVYESAGL